MTQDLYLRFTDQPEAVQVLDALGMVNDGEISPGGHQYALWQVGEIAGRNGWHINIRVVDPEFDTSQFEPYRVYPPYPVCVWA